MGGSLDNLAEEHHNSLIKPWNQQESKIKDNLLTEVNVTKYNKIGK